MKPLVCIITGPESGIGAATALELGTEGCPVHLVGRCSDKLARVVDEVRVRGGFADAHPCDVTVVEPGMVDTPMVDNPFANELKKHVRPLDANDCARAIRFALEQPPHCSVNEIVLRPTSQVL